MAVWKSIKIALRRVFNPRNKLRYLIPRDVIQFTVEVLQQYNPNEGVVYWAGTYIQNEIFVEMAIAPKAATGPGFFEVNGISNANVILKLHEYKKIHLAQVHSHPGNFLDHSNGDEKMAAFKKEGLLSIVVPNYGVGGMLPLTICGVHIFRKKFFRIGDRYIKKHFKIIDKKSILIDLRDA